MDWTLEYTARTDTGIVANARTVVRHAQDMLPGVVPGVADTLFSGRLAMDLDDGLSAVIDLIEAVNSLEQEYSGLHVDVVDSLSMIRRGQDGALVLDPDGDATVERSPWGVHLVDDGAADDIFSELLSVADTDAAPFDELLSYVPLHPPQSVPAGVLAHPGRFLAEEVQVTRQDSKDSAGALFMVTADVRLTEGELGHLFDADVLLIDSAGELLATDRSAVTLDVRRRGELYVGCHLDMPLADRVSRIDVFVDSYVRYRLPTVRWEAGAADVSTAEDGRVRLTARFAHSAFPCPGLDVVGTVQNVSEDNVSTTDLNFEVYDGADEEIGDEPTDIGMMAAGDSRPFRLSAILEDDDVVARACLRGNYVVRRRHLLLTINIIRSN